MQFHDLQKKLPKHGQRCVIKEKLNNRVDIAGSACLQIWFDDSRFMCHPNVVSWAPVPEHVNIDPVGWLSEYRGHDLPERSCSCLVSTESSKVVRYAYFHAELNKFLGFLHGDVLAFIPI